MYHLFAGFRQHPGGGLWDHQGAFDCIAEAQAAYDVHSGHKRPYEWGQIVEGLPDGRLVLRMERDWDCDEWHE